MDPILFPAGFMAAIMLGVGITRLDFWLEDWREARMAPEQINEDSPEFLESIGR